MICAVARDKSAEKARLESKLFSDFATRPNLNTLAVLGSERHLFTDTLLLLLTGCQLPTFGAYKGATTQAQSTYHLWQGFFIAGISTPASRRKPATWTGIDRDYEVLRAEMHCLFRRLGIDTPPAAA